MAENKRSIYIIRVLVLIILIVLIVSIVINKVNKDNQKKLAIETVLPDDSILAINDINKGDNYEADEENVLPVFMYSSLSEEIIEKIVGASYKENTPVNLDELSYIRVTYWGFDDLEHIGEIIVHKKLAVEVTEIFKELYEARFPIDKIRLIDEYGADDNISMSANNSSAFCSREITGKKDVFSNHSYGVAIDINPVQNPYIKGDTILPKEGSEYLDRENIRKGMIIKDDICYNAFINRGWTWGGEWSSLKDYQHFEKNLEDD